MTASFAYITKQINDKIRGFKLFILLINLFDWSVAHSPQAESYTDAVLLVRLDAIGDFILWLDAAKELRKLYPDKKVVLCANKIWSDLAISFPYWDEVVAVEVNRLRWDLCYRIKLFISIRKLKFRVAIQPTFSRDLTGDSLIRSTGAEQRIGSQGDLSNITEEDKARSDTWYTQLISADVAPMMEIKRNAEFLRGLGAVNFLGSVTNLERILDVPCELVPVAPYYVVFPGALWKYKVWPASKYAELIIKFSKQREWHIVLCGSQDEKSICDEICENSGDLFITNLAGKTSLLELVEVIRGAKMVVGNDTSSIHIAAATGTPSVCILGGGHWGRFLPYEPEKEENRVLPTTVIEKMDCYGCGWRCVYPGKRNKPFPCIDRISVDQVEYACIKVASEISEHTS